VTSLNSDASAIFNRSVSANNQGSGGNNTSGYLVDPDGNIQFPVLGNVKAEGLTKLQLKEKMTASLKDQKLLFDPIVTVRLGNYKVTVLGEVKNPNVIYVPSEKITILEAIGFAGDLTLSAKRDKVVLIREEQGNKTIRRLNLTNNDIFNSPYYYLKSDDVLYVEATKAKIAGTTGARTWLPIVFSAVSMTALVFSRLIR
jgi:polysaccharide export outer membrane protein